MILYFSVLPQDKNVSKFFFKNKYFYLYNCRKFNLYNTPPKKIEMCVDIKLKTTCAFYGLERKFLFY